MSTRAHIAFYEQPDQPLESPSILLYRHSDGYPSAVLPDIVPFLHWFHGRRGLSDCEYAAARLLQHLCNIYDRHTAAFAARRGHLPEETPFTGTLGYGICPGNALHGDIAYLYAVKPNGRLAIFHCPSESIDTTALNMLGSVALTGTNPLTETGLGLIGQAFEHKAEAPL